MHLTPAAYCARLFGGARPLSRALGMHFTAVSRWKRCCNGFIPEPKHMQRLLRIAKERGYDIQAEDLIFGREVEEPVAIVTSLVVTG